MAGYEMPCAPTKRLVLFFLLIFAGSAAQALPVTPPQAYTAALPRIEADVRVDGILDEPVWAEAYVLGGFAQYLPVDGRPAAEATEVRVWYSPTAIYFGIRAHAAPGTVRATLADRDKIEGDDFVLLLLDTFDDQRQAFVIGVNPLGIQADGILRDASQQAGMMGTGGGRAYAIDQSPDFVFDSKGRLTADGYEIEVRVPFKSLRYQSGDMQQWGFNVIRRVQHSGFENTWAPVLQQNASFLSQSGKLTGLTGLRRGLVLDINPELTANAAGTPDGDQWRYERNAPQVGGNVRWGITNNLSLTATVNPDFSQVEADVARIQYDPRQTLFFPEKRPFFLDGIELFQMPNQLIYTRRVVDPNFAAKLTGKISGTNVAALSALDDPDASLTGQDRRYFNVLRLRRDLAGQSSVGMAYTDVLEGDYSNRVAGFDGRLVLRKLYTLTFQGAGSFTDNGTARLAAPLWDAQVSRSGRGFGFNTQLRGIHPDFRAASGYFGRVGIVRANFTPRYTLYGQPGAALERWTNSVTFDGTWDYDRFTAGREPNDAKLHLNSAFGLRGGWQLSTSLLIESFKYPPSLYRNYFIEQPAPSGIGVDTVAYTGTDRLFNLDVVGVIATPRFQQFSGSLFVIAGQDENFFEWASAYIFFIEFNGEWRPTEQLRVNLLYNHQQYFRKTDGSLVGQRRVPRLKAEYQLTRALFVRLVGQYDASSQDVLRDDSRTNAPILIYDPRTNTYARTTPLRDNSFSVDGLVSYRPTPGTVFFLGYGSTLQEPDSFRFGRLARTRDGFFVKLSYLYRI